MKFNKIINLKFLICIIMLMICSVINGQNHNVDTLFKNAINLYQNDQKDSSIQIFKQIINIKQNKNGYLYGGAFYNIPEIYLELGKNDEALLWYNKVIESDLKDNTDTGNLMQPYTNYKHNSSLRIAEIYESRKEFEKALEWINKADTLYRYWGFEGSATNISKRKSYILSRKTEVLLELDKEEEAIKVILTEILNSGELEDFFHSNKSTLFELTNKKKLKKEYSNSIKKFEVKRIDKKNWVVEIKLLEESYKIKFSKNMDELKIPHYYSKVYVYNKREKIDKKFITNYLKNRELFK